MDTWTSTPNTGGEMNHGTSTIMRTSTGPNHMPKRGRLTCRDWQEKARSGSMQPAQEWHRMGVSARKHSGAGNHNYPRTSTNRSGGKRIATGSHGVVQDASHRVGANVAPEDPMSHRVQKGRANMQHGVQSNKSRDVQKARQGKRASFVASRHCLPLYSTISRRT